MYMFEYREYGVARVSEQVVRSSPSPLPRISVGYIPDVHPAQDGDTCIATP